MKTPVLSRRELFAVTGGAVVAAGTVAALKQGAEDDPLAAMASGRTVVLQDRRLPLPEEVRARLGEGVQLLTLEQDPVRMWRGEHAAVLPGAILRWLRGPKLPSSTSSRKVEPTRTGEPSSSASR